MELYKRPNSPNWMMDVTLDDGRRVRKSTGLKSKGEAQKWAFDEIARLNAPEVTAEAKGLTMDQCVMDYVTHLESNGQVWAEGALSISNKMFGRGAREGKGLFAFDPKTPITSISRKDLDALQTARRSERLSSGTIAREMQVLRAALYLAKERGHKIPDIKWSIPQTVQKTRYLSVEEWHRIHTELDPKRPYVSWSKKTPGKALDPASNVILERELAQDLFIALTLCGGRFGEVKKLTVDQVLGDGTLKLWGNKTKKWRVVPVPAEMQVALERRKAASKAQGSVYLFPAGKTAGKRGTPSKPHLTTSRALARAFERSGVNAPHLVERDGKATIHSLRHTFASWLLQSGQSLAAVQDLLGHTTMDMTRRYAHLSRDSVVKEAAATLSNVIQINPRLRALNSS